ncbi:jg16637 [Pararge aegeria aegeria]|uniref:Jg16637 protein n=1 Tax=Pararge aegeria aegeria TaxID=348720 RepID=A0A8S4REI1_9NEOP|nr:jg16637 [Pararge aegeria aegeria]
MTYGTETWPLTIGLIRSLRDTQRAIERAMLGVSLRDQIRNEEIRRRTRAQLRPFRPKHSIATMLLSGRNAAAAQKASESGSARSEGDSSGDQSCESSDEGVGRDAAPHQQQAHQPMLQPHQPLHNMSHHGPLNHQMNNMNSINNISNHPMNHSHQRNSPRPLERELKVRDDFESLKTSLHPHLSSLASLAQGPPLSTPSSVFALASGGANFPYAPPAFLAPAPPPPAQPVGSASSSSSEGSAAGWSFEEQYKQVRQRYIDWFFDCENEKQRSEEKVSYGNARREEEGHRMNN